MILDPDSLVKTIDNVNEMFLYDMTIPDEEKLEAARWIVSRLGAKGSYRGMFAPTQSDFEMGIRVFTGEKLVSASARHIMGQEAARVVWLLGNADQSLKEAYHRATNWMPEAPDFRQSGTFCCARCTLAFWRHLWVGDFKHKQASLQKGLKVMERYRLGDGRWQRFPFFYAIYTLVDLDVEPAIDELRYARPVMERYVKRSHQDTYSKRRIAIINKALDKVS